MASKRDVMPVGDDIGQQTEGALNVLRQTVKDNPHKLSKAHLDVLRVRITKLEAKLAKLRGANTRSLGDDKPDMGELRRTEDHIPLRGTVVKDASPFDRDTDAGAAKIVKRERNSGLSAKQIAAKYGFDIKFVLEVGNKADGVVEPV